MVLTALRAAKDGRITREEVAELCKVTRPKAYHLLKKMCDDGELEKHGGTRGAYYTENHTEHINNRTGAFNDGYTVSYRVNSKRGAQFPIWATSVLQDHLLKGYSINERRLHELNQTIRLIADVATRQESRYNIFPLSLPPQV